MDPVHIKLTTPIIARGSTLWFSAYGFGWGYCAFELKAEVVCKQLGAADESPKQLLLAFQLGKSRLLGAAERTVLPPDGERIEMTEADLVDG